VKLLQVVDWGTSMNGDVTVNVKGVDGRDSRVEMSREVALEMLLALHDAVSDSLSNTVPERAVIEVARCLKVVSVGSRLAVVLETSEGLELPLALDRAAVESLSSCIRGDHAASARH
jgi:hypothetical protein